MMCSNCSSSALRTLWTDNVSLTFTPKSPLLSNFTVRNEFNSRWGGSGKAYVKDIFVIIQGGHATAHDTYRYVESLASHLHSLVHFSAQSASGSPRTR